MGSQVEILPERRAAKALAGTQLFVHRVDVFRLVYLLFERGATFFAFERAQVLVRSPYVANKPVVERKRRRAAIALEVANPVVLALHMLGKISTLITRTQTQKSRKKNISALAQNDAKVWANKPAQFAKQASHNLPFLAKTSRALRAPKWFDWMAGGRALGRARGPGCLPFRA